MRPSHPALAAALLLPLLAACGGTARTPAEPEPAGYAECRAEGQRAADAVNLGRQAMPGNPTQTDRLAAERSAIGQRAFEDCLRRRGLARGGGVEAVRRPGMF